MPYSASGPYLLHPPSTTPVRQQEHPSDRSLLYLLAPVPSLASGLFVMQASDVPATIWGQNVAAWTAGTLLCFGIRRIQISALRWTWNELIAVLTLAAMVATLLASGMQGVHRWIELGPVRLHAAAIVLPLLVVTLEGLWRTRGWWISACLAGGVTVILFLQPDAAQATAIAVASAVLLLPGAGPGALRRVWILSLLVLAGMTWLRRDPLGRVPYVEDIVDMAARLGAGWAVAAVVSLLLLPAPFVLAGRGASRRVGLALGTYVTITLLAPLVGNFPVPVLGYGVSPILGYMMGMGIFLRPAAPLQEQNPHGTADAAA